MSHKYVKTPFLSQPYIKFSSIGIMTIFVEFQFPLLLNMQANLVANAITIIPPSLCRTEEADITCPHSGIDQRTLIDWDENSLMVYSQDLSDWHRTMSSLQKQLPSRHGPDYDLPRTKPISRLTLSNQKSRLSPMTVPEMSPGYWLTDSSPTSVLVNGRHRWVAG